MKLIYLDKELDNTKEIEILSGSKFGFKVTVAYTMDSWMSKHAGRQMIDVYDNCTEVHYLYPQWTGNERRIAFESDIHGTGCNRKVEEIESVKIDIATKEYKSF